MVVGVEGIPRAQGLTRFEAQGLQPISKTRLCQSSGDVRPTGRGRPAHPLYVLSSPSLPLKLERILATESGRSGTKPYFAPAVNPGGLQPPVSILQILLDLEERLSL